jgi:excisionase family DNA binding protein
MASDHTHDTPQPSYERQRATEDSSRVLRLTVAEAAEMLGITRSAVRKRVERGSLQADKDDDGMLFVYLDPTATSRETGHDSPRQTPHPTRRDEGLYRALDILEEQNRFLRAQLEHKDAIIMSLTQRIPELEPARESSSEERGSPTEPSGGRRRGDAPERESELMSRPWWRRWFGV